MEHVAKVASACRQYTSSKQILTKLLARIIMTEDTAVQRQLMRFHGFSMMSTILHEYSDDAEVIIQVLQVLRQWPLITRNKLMSTNIESKVIELSETDDEPIATPAKGLLEMWQALEIGYRIPKAMREALQSGDESRKREAEDAVQDLFSKRARIEREHADDAMALPKFVRPKAIDHAALSRSFTRKECRSAPQDWSIAEPWPMEDSDEPVRYVCTLTQMIHIGYPPSHVQAAEAEKYRKANTVAIGDIIARVRAEAEAKAAVEAAAAAAVVAETARKAQELKEAKEKRAERRQQKDAASKDKRVYRLFGEIVVKTMSKYKQHLDPEQFKRRAKEICETLCAKEKKKPDYATESYTAFTPKQARKIKDYVEEWLRKVWPCLT